MMAQSMGCRHSKKCLCSPATWEWRLDWRSMRRAKCLSATAVEQFFALTKWDKPVHWHSTNHLFRRTIWRLDPMVRCMSRDLLSPALMQLHGSTMTEWLKFSTAGLGVHRAWLSIATAISTWPHHCAGDAAL